MSDIVIRAENLGKKYIIGHQAEVGRYTALRDTLMQNAQSIWHKTRDLFHGQPIIQGDTLEEVWALKDVDFEVRQGEAVGIIGRNGSGKSTLLKILSRITEPSTGRVALKGRVASLLEVGTGFHPELTGRENIYLNGAILGMTRREIKQKFDEIVSFAEVEKYLDTPVKRYSSGMYVRLAFAVAAHLEPEILVVDEVLAVGDAAFQKKCLDKMGSVAEGGRTILFVSHNMGAIRTLCNRAILLSQGHKILDAAASDVITKYLANAATGHGQWTRKSDIPDREGIYILTAGITDTDGNILETIDPSNPFQIRITIDVQRPMDNAQVAVRITNQEGIPIFTTANTDFDEVSQPLPKGIQTFAIEVPAHILTPGHYSIIVASMIPRVIAFDIIDGELGFKVEDFWTHATRDGRYGVVAPKLEWTVI